MIFTNYIKLDEFIKIIKDNFLNCNETNIKLCYLYYDKFEIFWYNNNVRIKFSEQVLDKFKVPPKLSDNENKKYVATYFYKKYLKEINITEEDSEKTSKNKSKKKIYIKNPVKFKRDVEFSKDKEKTIPTYKLKEFWNYSINPITGFAITIDKSLNYLHTNYWIDKNINS